MLEEAPAITTKKITFYRVKASFHDIDTNELIGGGIDPFLKVTKGIQIQQT